MCKCNVFIVFLTLLIFNGCLWRIQAFRVFDVNGVKTILALKNEKIVIDCKTDMPMSYCGLVHPSGKRYSFSGSTLNAGQCAIAVKISEEDTGLWRCHIGTQTVGLEIMQRIQVRVVTEVAAVQKNITAVHGKPITLTCATTKGLEPLSYCRFEPPNGRAFSINADVTESVPILGRYFFPSNRSLDRGDCAVTIRKVKYEDVGLWTCGAGLDDKEYIDVIKFEVEGLYSISTASATGITFGVFGIAAVLSVLGFIAWKRRRFLGASVTPENIEPEGHELQEMPRSPTPRTPQLIRNVPRVIVESPQSEPSDPSDPSVSPLISQVGV